MKKILFLIHDLGNGGAEKVLVNLVNNMDRTEYDISVTALFGGGINEQFLDSDIHYRAMFPRSIPGNSKLMKVFSPHMLHKLFIREKYDIEVAYLEGPSARIVSGCSDENTKLVVWIHSVIHTSESLAGAFRKHSEAEECYRKFNRIVCVSQRIKKDFESMVPAIRTCEVLYNTVETEKIKKMSEEAAPIISEDKSIKLIAVGRLIPVKGYERLLHIMEHFNYENRDVHLYILGKGQDEKELKAYVESHGLQEKVVFLGYDTNPYKYVAKSDIYLCSSYSEGFSTAATESLIVGTPVVTVDVSGMKEMLGEKGEYGIITENSEEALEKGIVKLLEDQELYQHYKKQAKIRGAFFSTENTVQAVEKMFSEL